jgi:photosystem II stability/assembly factor-like uncharacterized protein
MVLTQAPTTFDPAIAIATSPAGVSFIARESGLFRSMDGILWSPVPGVSAASLAFVGDRALLAGVAGGVLRSADGGESWQSIPFGSPPPLVTALSAAGDHVLAGSFEDGVFRSTDGGLTWRTANIGLLDYNVLALAQRGETAYAGTGSGLFRSRTAGRSWRAIDFPDDTAPVVAMAIAPDGRVLAGTESAGLYLSSDQDDTWIRISPLSDVIQLTWTGEGVAAIRSDGQTTPISLSIP